MSDPKREENRASFVAQSSLVTQLPDERLAVLRRMDFAVLKDGEQSGIRASRDLCYGVAATGVVGFIGLLATIDWQVSIKSADLRPFIWTGTLAVITLSFLGIGIFFQIQINRKKGSSAYSILMKRLDEHFSESEAVKKESK
jgi:hypothetical protein